MRNETTVTGITKKAFASTGPLSKLIKNYTPNQIQIEYAEKVAQVFDGASRSKISIGMIEAGTGIGKTLGYSIPLLAYASLSGKRVAISTYTIQLQSQLLNVGGDIDVAQQVIYELTGRPLVVAPRLGLRNFVSPIRISAAMAEKGITHETASDSVKNLVDWAEKSKTGMFLEWNALHGEIPSEFSISDICCEHYLPAAEKLRYEIHKDHAKSADVIITNHALTIMHAVSSGRSLLDGSESKPLSILVADEADRIESAAELISNRSATLISIRSFFAQQKDSFSKSICESVQAICDLARRVDPGNNSKKEKSHVDLRDNPSVSAEITAHITKILPLFDKVLKKCGDEELKSEITLYKDALSRFKDRTHYDHASAIPVIHYSDVRRYPSLQVVNPNPGTLFGLLWQDNPIEGTDSYLDSVLLTSATLSDGQVSSLKNAANSMGLFRSSNHELITGIFEPTDFGEISLVLPESEAPSPTLTTGDDEFSTDPEWVSYVTDMIIEASNSGERVLALTLSYRDTGLIAELLRERRPDIQTLIQHTESDPIHGLINRFAVTEGAILLSPCCWEGINLPGLVKNLVITRIPFAPPDKVRADIIKESMTKKGIKWEIISSAIYGLSVVQTRRKLRQAIGRGIRQKSDVSRVWFGDKRILEQKGKLKLDSCLPARFVLMLKTADTFALDRSVSSPEVVEKPKTIVWAKSRVYF